MWKIKNKIYLLGGLTIVASTAMTTIACTSDSQYKINAKKEIEPTSILDLKIKIEDLEKDALEARNMNIKNNALIEAKNQFKIPQLDIDKNFMAMLIDKETQKPLIESNGNLKVVQSKTLIKDFLDQNDAAKKGNTYYVPIKVNSKAAEFQGKEFWKYFTIFADRINYDYKKIINIIPQLVTKDLSSWINEIITKHVFLLPTYKQKLFDSFANQEEFKKLSIEQKNQIVEIAKIINALRGYSNTKGTEPTKEGLENLIKISNKKIGNILRIEFDNIISEFTNKKYLQYLGAKSIDLFSRLTTMFKTQGIFAALILIQKKEDFKKMSKNAFFYDYKIKFNDKKINNFDKNHPQYKDPIFYAIAKLYTKVINNNSLTLFKNTRKTLGEFNKVENIIDIFYKTLTKKTNHVSINNSKQKNNLFDLLLNLIKSENILKTKDYIGQNLGVMELVYKHIKSLKKDSQNNNAILEVPKGTSKEAFIKSILKAKKYEFDYLKNEAEWQEILNNINIYKGERKLNTLEAGNLNFKYGNKINQKVVLNFKDKFLFNSQNNLNNLENNNSNILNVKLIDLVMEYLDHFANGIVKWENKTKKSFVPLLVTAIQKDLKIISSSKQTTSKLSINISYHDKTIEKYEKQINHKEIVKTMNGVLSIASPLIQSNQNLKFGTIWNLAKGILKSEILKESTFKNSVIDLIFENLVNEKGLRIKKEIDLWITKIPAGDVTWIQLIDNLNGSVFKSPDSIINKIYNNALILMKNLVVNLDTFTEPILSIWSSNNKSIFMPKINDLNNGLLRNLYQIVNFANTLIELKAFGNPLLDDKSQLAAKKQINDIKNQITNFLNKNQKLITTITSISKNFVDIYKPIIN